jgi:guanylate kinase
MVRKRLFIFSAPSGAGKTTIARHLLERYPDRMAFSISATTRSKRPNEQHGRDYYFLSKSEFEDAIARGEFVEYEEFFGNYYGTLKSEIERILHPVYYDGSTDTNKKEAPRCPEILVFDIDVKGALSLRRAYPQESLLIFVAPPSLEELRRRLSARNTESEEQLQLRFARAEMEMQAKEEFDVVIVNDNLEQACAQARALAEEHLLMSSAENASSS